MTRPVYGPPRGKPAVCRKLVTLRRGFRTLACDGRCDKAFGANGRPKIQLSADPDDYVYVPDDLLGTAPGPGDTVIIPEGDHVKPSAIPLTDGSRMNKWCYRECERSIDYPDHAYGARSLTVPDLNRPAPNMPRGRQ